MTGPEAEGAPPSSEDALLELLETVRTDLEAAVQAEPRERKAALRGVRERLERALSKSPDTVTPSAPAPHRVLLVNVPRLFRAALTSYLLSIPGVDVVGEAADAADAIRLVPRLRPDTVFVDLMLRGMEDFDSIRRLAALDPAPRVLVISHSVDREYVRQAFRAGASGYLPKCADPGELPMALESLGRGRVWTSPSVSRPEVQEPSGGRADAAPSRPRPDLTPRQREVLRQIAEGRSTKEIARRLRVSVKTVESHRAQIMERLGIRQVAGLVKYAIRAGIAALHEP